MLAKVGIKPLSLKLTFNTSYGLPALHTIHKSPRMTSFITELQPDILVIHYVLLHFYIQLKHTTHSLQAVYFTKIDF